jgi:hypothetical protein
MLTLLTDFNAVRNGLARTLREEVDGTGEPGEGERVLLDDGEGNRAFGIVRRIESDLVFAEVDWNSWSTAGAGESGEAEATAFVVVPRPMYSLPVPA